MCNVQRGVTLLLSLMHQWYHAAANGLCPSVRLSVASMGTLFAFGRGSYCQLRRSDPLLWAGDFRKLLEPWGRSLVE